LLKPVTARAKFVSQKIPEYLIAAADNSIEWPD
jgi:hypothetical protein